ncbi:uncharacterized protein LOC125764999 [Anopheles funestus]|uniref:uncharacterized protein LOC125764999 n=1 Tax=Anopheles funestus TaxID=62324 RepID=UPI0020C65425|nr:uncharacterized protein LOC125764999 [Anopheles funestus]
MGGKLKCGWWCCVLWLCSYGFGCLKAETIHFTNSPKLIMASKNFTTYEIEVPGSKPITIIEATDPYDRGSSNGRPLDTFPKEVQLPGGPTTSFRTSTGLSVSRPANEQSSASSSEQSTGSRKTLYSPELLNKFLKEYSEKLRNADSATRKRLNEITMINNSVNRNQNELPGVGSADENQYRNKHPHLDAIQAESQNDTDERLPVDEPKTEDEFVFNDTHERHVMSGLGATSNKRWYQEPALGGYQTQPQQTHSHKNHPWNIKDGWVSLEAVPWSESKVSKWHASGSMSELNKNSPGKVTAMQHALDKYWNTGSVASEETPKYKPVATSGSIGSSSYYNGNGDDDYGYGALHSDNRAPVNRLPPSSVTPTESLYNRRRPIATLYSDRPDPERGRPTAPPQPQLDSWYDQQLHTSNPYDSMKAYHDQGPNPTASISNRDIITDGRPANFPKFAPDRPGQGGGYSVDDHNPPSERVRPVSYPDRGNGEWVLISTTKGYQYPKRRHGQRAITFSPATSTSHQTVKLTVLPMKNAIDMTTSHNGLIEVSSSTQTVEDAVKQQKSKRKGQYPGSTATSLVGQKKKKHSAAVSPAGQTFSLMRRDASQDSSAVLAAVGAGMVPATMAILAPMVLGRKKK